MPTKNIKRAVAVLGAATALVSSTATVASAAEEPNVGPYNCKLSVPILAEQDPTLLGALMCKGPIKDEASPSAEPDGSSSTAPAEEPQSPQTPPADTGDGNDFPEDGGTDGNGGNTGNDDTGSGNTLGQGDGNNGNPGGNKGNGGDSSSVEAPMSQQGSGQLAETGSKDSTWMLLGLGGGLIAAGSGAMVFKRNRRTS